MKQKLIGRNEPCLCGSGKKYKKCCYGKLRDNKIKTRQIIPGYHEIDHTKPILDDSFFNGNNVHEFSAQRLLYSSLLIPEAEVLATQITKLVVKRGEEEKEIIERTEDINVLMDIMRNRPDALNYIILINKLIQYKNASVPLIIEELKKTKSDAFIELAIRVLHRTGDDYSNEILETIKYHQRDAYAVSQLSMLLGFYENKESEQVLWDYFHFFKRHVNDEPYSDGPLLGLIEMRARTSEKKMKNRKM